MSSSFQQNTTQLHNDELLLLQRTALRFELQSARAAVLNAHDLKQLSGASAAEIESACVKILDALASALGVRAATAQTLDTATAAMVRNLVREMETRFKLLSCGAALRLAFRSHVWVLVDRLAPRVQPAVDIAPENEIEIQAIVDGPRTAPRFVEHERRVAAAQQTIDPTDLTRLLVPLSDGQRTTETLLVGGQALRGELVLRRTARKNDAIGDVLSASSIADHWFAAVRGGGDGELMSLVRDRQLAYAVRVHVPQIGDVVVAAHAGLWQLRTPERSCATAAAPLRAALVRYFGSEHVLQCMFESVEQWQAHELRNWRACAEQTARRQHLLPHERDESLKRCKMTPVFL